MPNFVKMDTKPFHPDTYLGPEEEESMQAESVREKSMTIKLKVENTVRWRWIKDTNGCDVCFSWTVSNTIQLMTNYQATSIE